MEYARRHSVAATGGGRWSRVSPEKRRGTAMSEGSEWKWENGRMSL